MALGGRHTHTRKHTDIRGRNDFKKSGARGQRPCVSGLKINFKAFAIPILTAI